MLGILWYPFHFIITYYLFDYHIEPSVSFGPGLFLHNRDIVITDNTVIGINASIMGQVTIGTDFLSDATAIRIGDNVRIGSGAKIIAKRKLNIANNVTIGANAVVARSILKSGVYVGVPAKRLDK